MPEESGPTQRIKRRRAARACLSCRTRKVRCDVSRSGPPCMNCSLDGIACVVKARKPKSSVRRHRQPSHREDSVDDSERNNDSGMKAALQQSNVLTANTGLQTTVSGQLTISDDQSVTHEDQASYHSFDAELIGEKLTTVLPGAASTTQPASCVANNRLSASSQRSEADCLEIPPRQQHRRLHLNSVVYTYYPFLTLNNLFNCLPRDVDFLESEGCFHLPTRGIMDQIVRQYFLHIHPLLPLLNEGDFWEMYHNKRSTAEDSKMSLLVFQAMIFVSCNFVDWSMESAKSFKYKNIRGLRAALYRRAKLLYDFGAETSPVAVAQAALLLSYWTPPVRTETKPNTVWLSIAIQNAKNAEAPYYAIVPPSPRALSASEAFAAKRINVLKRLWWCCVIRDRILPLGLRRGIQITRAHFDFEKHQPLGLMDLDDEIHRSMVYNADSKRELIRLFSQVLELCVILTDVLLLVFPLDGALDETTGQPALVLSEEAEIQKSKKALVHWYTAAVTASTGLEEGRTETKWAKHESVALYTHLMYTYYHSARMALYNHELQHYLALTADSPSENSQRLLDTRDAIQNAFSNITENLRGLNQRHLIRWLPISAVAYIAFPLALHILNIHLSAARQPQSNTTLIEVIRVMHLQYDGVDWLARLVRHLVDLVQDDPALADGRNVADWAELIAVKPRTYLRLSLALDLSMSSGKFPDKKDFLARLDVSRLNDSARAVTNSGQSPRIRKDHLTLLDGMVTTDDPSLPIDIYSLDSQNRASIVTSGPEGVLVSETQEGNVEEGQSSNPLAHLHSPCLREGGLEVGNDQPSSFIDDLGEFLDHTMAELTASEDSIGAAHLADHDETDLGTALFCGSRDTTALI